MEQHFYDNKEQVKLALVKYFTEGETFNEWLDKHWWIVRDLDEMDGILELYAKPDLLEGIYYKDCCPE